MWISLFWEITEWDKDIIGGMRGWRISLHGNIVRSHIMSQKLRLSNIIPLILAFVVYCIRLPCSEREATSPQDGELRLLRAKACNTSHMQPYSCYSSSIKPQLHKCFSCSWLKAFLEAWTVEQLDCDSHVSVTWCRVRVEVKTSFPLHQTLTCKCFPLKYWQIGIF